MRCQVVAREHSVGGGGMFSNAFSEIALVKRFARGFGDSLECARVVGQTDLFTGPWRSAVGTKRLLILSELTILLVPERPVVGGLTRDEIAVACIGDGGLEEFLNRQ